MNRIRSTHPHARPGRSPLGLWRLGLTGVLALSALACTGSPDPFSDPSIPVRMAAEKEFALQLESNASTGYAWRLARPLDEAVVVLLGSRYQPNGNPQPGAPGAEVWRFRTVAKGETTIELEYVRAWETDVPPNRTAEFTVIVE